MFTLVRRARQRLLYNELLSQGANASSAALLALILLLLFGTEVLDWRWALAIPLVAVAAGGYLARRRRPSPYTVAQIVDRRCALADTLSTALFFTRVEPPSQVSRDIRQAQFEQAGRLSETVDLCRAVPYTIPRAAYLLAALLVVSASLFALRYGLSRRLDLKPPLARILQLKFGASQSAEQAQGQRPNAPREPGSPDEGTAPSSDPDQQPEASSDPIQDTVAGQPGGKSGQEQTRQSQAQQEGSNNSGENSSLLTKAEDAIENLLSSLQPPRNLPGAQPKSGQEKAGRQQPAKGQPGGGQPGNSSDGQPGKEASDSQDSQGKSAGTGDTEQAGRQPGSGAGSQDGDKNTRQAEQLAAMGKISEIIGKRSANVSGEATVEVRSTSQQLRTPYAPRGAQHSQGGAEIGRDEIPVALQTYVERYFEQVRQPAPPGK